MKIKGKEVKGIKKAVGIFNSWQGYSIIVFNRDKLSVTAHQFFGGEEYQYGDSEFCVASKAEFSMWERDDKTKMEFVKDAVETHLQQYMNTATGAVDYYDGWNCDRNGVVLNDVEEGGVVPVHWNKEEECWEEVK